MTAGLAAPIFPSDNIIGTGGNDANVNVAQVDGPLDDEHYHASIVPVPPASAAASDHGSSFEDEHQQPHHHRRQRELLHHRPHPSCLHQTNNANHHQQRQRQRQRSLHHITTGTFHNLVLLLRFADHASRSLPTQADISRLYNSEETTILQNGLGAGDDDDDIAPTGSVRQVYHANSHGAFTIQTTVVDWITLDYPESYYANGNHGFSKFKEAIIEGLNHLDATTAFDFGDFDLDENGSLDGLGVLHSGYGAEFAGSDCKGAENEQRIWSHKGGLTWETSSSPSSNNSGNNDDVITVNRYYVSSSLRGKCQSNIVRMGVICHELGHYLGLPDLYDGTFDGAGLGAYDFMSQSWGWDGSGLYPPNLSAWSKLQVGWAEAELIVEDGTYELQASTLSNKVYKIEEGYPDGEYLLIENRQPNGYDSKIHVGGLAIYHIDENANGQQLRGYPSQSNWPTNGEHYKVAMLAADGSYDLEKGNNHGDDGDLWHSSSPLRELKSNGPFPNTEAYQDGNVEGTGIRIFEFGNGGDTMTFRVNGLGKPIPPPTAKPVTNAPSKQPSNSPVVTSPPTSPPSISPTQPPTSSQYPTVSPTSSSPTHSPTSWEDEVRCDYLCLEPIAPEECPMAFQLDDCRDVGIGELCDADGECDTNQFLDNCGALDVYRRMDCYDSANAATTTATNASGTATSSGATVTATSAANDGVLEGMTNWSTHEDVLPHSSTGVELLTSLVTLTDSPTSDPLSALLGSPTSDPLSALLGSPTSDPLSAAAPSNKPTMLVITGSKPAAASISASNSAMTNANNGIDHQDSNNNCPYYPGWNLGLTYCLKDCHQPPYMISSPIFEFTSLEECCDLHYQGHASCRTQSLLTIEKKYSTLSSGLASVSGQIWKDLNGNNWRDVNERQMGSGMHGVYVDLYECHDYSSSPSAPNSQWIQGTRTSFDGSYLLEEIPTPASYYVQITSPTGYHFHLSEEYRPWRDDFNAEGRSSCMEFTSNSGGASMDVILDAGLIPDALLVIEEGGSGVDDVMVTNTELVSKAAVNLDGVVEDDKDEELEGPPSYVGMHTKSHTSNSQGSQQEVVQVDDGNTSLSSPAISSTLHTKSGLRGSSSASYYSTISTSTPTMITVRPTDDTTIQSKSNMKFVGGTGELRVGPQLSWHDDILLKFDITPFALTGVSHQNDYRAANRAVLRLYSLTSSPSGGVVNFAPSNDWTEEMVDWSSAPDATTSGGGHVLAIIGRTRPDMWVEVDVTGILLTEDGIATLRITGEESNHSWVAEYSSKENGMGHPSPELRVYF
eukprot:CAMPEP_0172307488 /NCGR_PEP_ID=MMETSP1058-20130122/8325_1 /TAXON_ID=83371 /ORGANISM="Detonula confervacea, Strain CCMP 353" /LENGTH=1288 /DNA_ID=CAMNT_0013019663 /DNA_START=93 /DNA_END=3959 /DNA_ORIENTATION=+